MGDLALKNGAQAYLVKTQTSGDAVNMAIREAMTRVPHGERSFGEKH
jgi:hypothetical protein